MLRVAIFNIWFYAALVLYSAVVIPLFALAVTGVRLFSTRRRALRVFRRCISLYGRGIVSGLARPGMRVRYRDFSSGRERPPFVYACNHRSASDPFLLCFLPGEGVQVVNKWPFRLPVWGALARLAGYLNVRAMPVESFKAAVGRLLEQGTSVAAFPEGTRSASRRLGPFHGALFRACLEHGPDIVPLCIMGNEDKPRKGSLWLQPGEIQVHRLPGLCYDDYKHMKPFALKNHVRGLLQAHCARWEGTAHEDSE